MKKDNAKNFRANLRFRPEFKLTLNHGHFCDKDKQQKVISRVLKSLVQSKFVRIDIDCGGNGRPETIKAWRKGKWS